MNYDPNQPSQYPNQGQYGGGYAPQSQPTTDPYSGQQYGQQPGQPRSTNSPMISSRASRVTSNPMVSNSPMISSRASRVTSNPMVSNSPMVSSKAPMVQQGYQQPYGQQQSPYGAPGVTGSTMGMDPNVAAGLSYVAGWVTGLIFFLLEKQNCFVRFNALQSIMLSGAYIVFLIFISIVSGVLPFWGS